ncbi:hypothetical protein SGPA1_22032 [Streptomyces misionensis JCM 4497]
MAARDGDTQQNDVTGLRIGEHPAPPEVRVRIEAPAHQGQENTQTHRVRRGKVCWSPFGHVFRFSIHPVPTRVISGPAAERQPTRGLRTTKIVAAAEDSMTQAVSRRIGTLPRLWRRFVAIVLRLERAPAAASPLPRSQQGLARKVRR